MQLLVCCFHKAVYTFLESLTEIIYILDRQDNVALYLFTTHVSAFRLLLEQWNALLKGLIVSPSLSKSLYVLNPIPIILRTVVSSSSRPDAQQPMEVNDNAESEGDTESSNPEDIEEELLAMDWDSD